MRRQQLVIDDTGSVEGIYAFIYYTKWRFGQVSRMPYGRTHSLNPLFQPFIPLSGSNGGRAVKLQEEIILGLGCPAITATLVCSTYYLKSLQSNRGFICCL